MGTHRAVIITVFGLWSAFGAEAAFANVCVQLDTRDRLASEEQAASLQVFENAIVAAGETLGAPCETWQLSHVRLGTSIQILLVTPHGAITGAATSVESLAGTYDGMIWRALRSTMIAPRAEPPSPTTPGVKPVEVPPPASEATKGALYVRIGYALAPATDDAMSTRYGPAIGIGYRRPLDNWLFDLSIMNTHAWQTSDSQSGDIDLNILSFGRIAAMRVSPYNASSAVYYGGGLSFGQTTARIVQTAPYTYADTARGYSVQGEAVLGYEALRDRSVRLFVEGWLTLPLGFASSSPYDGTSSNEKTYYAPTLSVWGGLGF